MCFSSVRKTCPTQGPQRYLKIYGTVLRVLKTAQPHIQCVCDSRTTENYFMIGQAIC